MVVTALENNNVETGLPAPLREAATYYHFKYPSLRTTDQYQQIGMMLIKRFPCLAHDGTKPWVLEDFFTIINPGASATAQMKIMENLASLMTIVENMMPKSAVDGNTKQEQPVKFLEKSVAIERGKGVKSKSVITVLEVDDVDFREEGLRGLLKVKDKLPPSLKVLTMDGSFKVAYVVGDNKIIHCRAKDLYDALLLLLVTYYVMDLDYPAVYGQLLGFL